MGEVKRGAAMLLTTGDPTIANAIADGILTARAMIPARVESPEEEIIRKRAAEALRRIDMRCRPRDDEDDDIETRILKAEAVFGTRQKPPNVFRSLFGRLFGLYGLAVLKVHEYFDFENRRWKG
jgi:hypothetical protein